MNKLSIFSILNSFLCLISGQIIGLPSINTNPINSTQWTFLLQYGTNSGNYTSYINLQTNNCLTTFYQSMNSTNGQSLRTCIGKFQNLRTNRCVFAEIILKYDIVGSLTVSLPNKNFYWVSISDGNNVQVNSTLNDPNLKFYSFA